MSTNEWDENSEYLLKPITMPDGTAMSYIKVSNLSSILHSALLGEVYCYKLPNGNVSAVYWNGSSWQTYFSDVKGLLYRGIKPDATEMRQRIEEFYGVEIG